jgi:glucosamine--fructose-6-phosphate aminotransferase (isomerizing)
VLATLIGELYDPDHGDLEAAVQAALREVTGAYAIAVMSRERARHDGVCARKGSPLIIGIGNGEYIVASDGSAIIATPPGDDARRLLGRAPDPRRLRTSTIDNKELTPKVMQLELELDEIELGGFEHYMHKEIFEQPRALRMH